MKKIIKDIFLKFTFNILRNYKNPLNDLPFLPERMKLEKAKKLVANSYDNTEYVIHITNLKQALNHGLIFKKVHRGIKFNQKPWLKLYIDRNTKLRLKAKHNFDNCLF